MFSGLFSHWKITIGSSKPPRFFFHEYCGRKMKPWCKKQLHKNSFLFSRCPSCYSWVVYHLLPLLVPLVTQNGYRGKGEVKAIPTYASWEESHSGEMQRKKLIFEHKAHSLYKSGCRKGSTLVLKSLGSFDSTSEVSVSPQPHFQAYFFNTLLVSPWS